jgi:hypothetical protein
MGGGGDCEPGGGGLGKDTSRTAVGLNSLRCKSPGIYSHWNQHVAHLEEQETHSGFVKGFLGRRRACITSNGNASGDSESNKDRECEPHVQSLMSVEK